MNSVIRAGLAAVLVASVLLPLAVAAQSRHGVVRTGATVRVPHYGVFEHTFRWTGEPVANPWEQVRVVMTLTSPTGRRTQVGGFYVGQNRWAARFAPSEVGSWRWIASLSDGLKTSSSSGRFSVVRSGGHGPVRQSRFNRFRWLFADGTPYYPLGIGDCVRDDDHSGSPFDDFYVDTHKTNVGTYLGTYRRAGINLFRWSVDNCAFGLYRTISPDGNVYLEREGSWGDELVRQLRAQGFRVYMSIFGFAPPFATSPSAAELAALRRYVAYVVDRYGAYVDYWELMNEASATNDWYAAVGSYLHRIDPYHHPVATSWERPDLGVVDVNAPHWYETEPESESDARTWGLIGSWKAAEKPVIVGEQGNGGQNWDEGSALRMRIRAWTAFFAEGTLIFWNTSTTKTYHSAAANIYLGPDERRYLSVLHDFTRGFDPRARIVPVSIDGPGLRAYALAGPKAYAAYIDAPQNHSSPTRGAVLHLHLAHRGTATWISPETGRAITEHTVRPGTQTLAVPPFVTDISLKVRSRRR